MAKKKRSAFERERDLAIIAGLYLQGLYQREIADDIGVSRSQVRYDLSTIKRRWINSSLMDFNEAQQQALALVDHLEREAWAAWDKSKGERVKTRTKTSSKPMPGDKPSRIDQRDEVIIEKEERLGDHAYLAHIEWCINARCKILGLYAPEKKEVAAERTVTQPLTADQAAKKMAAIIAQHLGRTNDHDTG